jgi:hypothetical protein
MSGENRTAGHWRQRTLVTTNHNPQEHCLARDIAGTLCFDWQAAGFDARGYPVALKDPHTAGVTDVASLCSYFGDPWVNPASGGVIGKANIARELGISERQLQREVTCGSAGFIHRRGSLWASNVASIDAFGKVNCQGRAAAWSNNSPFTDAR